MMRMLVSLCLCGILSAAVAGCGKKKEVVDPYTVATLRQATYGEIVSDGFKYKILNPELIESMGDFVLIRQTNVTEFVTGPGIADKIKDLAPKDSLTFNVVKQFSPIVHFGAYSVLSKRDSVAIEQSKPIAFPRIADAATFAPPADYQELPMTRFRFNDTAGLRQKVGEKFAVRAKLVSVVEDSQTVWMLLGQPEDTLSVWMLEGKTPIPWEKPSKLRIRPPRPGLEIVLRLLAKTGQDFDGGFKFAEVEPIVNRRDNNVCGTIEIQYVRFLDKVFMR